MNMTQGSAVLLIVVAILFTNGSDRNFVDAIPLILNLLLFFYWWVNERTKKGKNE